MNSKWRGEVGEGGGERAAVATRREKRKNINCTARQTPKKLLTNERIRGGGEGGKWRSRAKRKSKADGTDAQSSAGNVEASAT